MFPWLTGLNLKQEVKKSQKKKLDSPRLLPRASQGLVRAGTVDTQGQAGKERKGPRVWPFKEPSQAALCHDTGFASKKSCSFIGAVATSVPMTQEAETGGS